MGVATCASSIELKPVTPETLKFFLEIVAGTLVFGDAFFLVKPLAQIDESAAFTAKWFPLG